MTYKLQCEKNAKARGASSRRSAGQPYRREVRGKRFVRNGREYYYHATKGWRNRRA